MNEAIVTTMLCLVNHPDTRQYVYAHFDIEVSHTPCCDWLEDVVAEYNGTNHRPPLSV